MPYRQRRLTAWLGILAIWFAIAVPVASQWRASKAAELEAIVCSAASGTTADDHRSHGLDQCGYCSFFAHVPAIDGAATALPDCTAIFARTRGPAPIATAFTVRYPRARPRAPPENI